MSEVALRHYPRHAFSGAIEIVDREFDFVRAILPYDYRSTSSAQQWHEAELICRALEGPMSAQGIVTVYPSPMTGGRGDQDAPSDPSRTTPST